jgi:hypothetical protein
MVRPLGRQDDVIEDADAEDRAGPGEALRDLAVLRAGADHPGGVVMQQHQRGSSAAHAELEDLARVDERLVGGPDRDGGVGDRPMAGVEVDRDEVLARVVPEDLAREADGVVRMFSASRSRRATSTRTAPRILRSARRAR